MLRISPTTTLSETCLVLEGRLVGAWVRELERAVRRHVGPVRLDLAQIKFVDADGVALLHRLQREGATVVALSPFVSELLKTRPS